MSQVDGPLHSARAGVEAGSNDWVQPFAHGTMRCVYFAPRDQDEQTPHNQDELYIVITGRGTLERGGERVHFVAGDTLFVAAGVVHRFIEFSQDLECWAIFWGPQGGEL